MSKKKKILSKSIAMLSSGSDIRLTDEQFEKLESFIKWNNSLSELNRMKSFDNDVSNIEIAFFVGGIYNKLESEFNEIEILLDDIKPINSDDHDDNDDQ